MEINMKNQNNFFKQSLQLRKMKILIIKKTHQNSMTKKINEEVVSIHQIIKNK